MYTQTGHGATDNASVSKDLKTAMNERVDDTVWVLKRCVRESVVMKIGDIHLGSTKMTSVWLELWSG